MYKYIYIYICEHLLSMFISHLCWISGGGFHLTSFVTGFWALTMKRPEPSAIGNEARPRPSILDLSRPHATNGYNYIKTYLFFRSKLPDTAWTIIRNFLTTQNCGKGQLPELTVYSYIDGMLD